MTTIATIAADSWSISIGGGWIVLILVGIGLCFIFVFSSMWLTRDGRGWAMCGRWSQQAKPPTEFLTNAPRQTPDPVVSPESEARP